MTEYVSAVMRVKKHTTVVTTFQRFDSKDEYDTYAVDHVFSGLFKTWKAKRFMKKNNIEWIVL